MSMQELDIALARATTVYYSVLMNRHYQLVGFVDGGVDQDSEEQKIHNEMRTALSMSHTCGFCLSGLHRTAAPCICTV